MYFPMNFCSDPGHAGTFYAEAGQHHRALELLILGGSDFIPQAIQVVARARDERLTSRLIDWIMDEVQDFSAVLRVYQALGNHAQTLRTAVLIAEDEQVRDHNCYNCLLVYVVRPWIYGDLCVSLSIVRYPRIETWEL